MRLGRALAFLAAFVFLTPLSVHTLEDNGDDIYGRYEDYAGRGDYGSWEEAWSSPQNSSLNRDATSHVEGNAVDIPSDDDIYGNYEDYLPESGNGGQNAETIPAAAEPEQDVWADSDIWAEAADAFEDGGDSDLSSLFDDASDMQGTESEPVTSAETTPSQDKKKIELYGKFNARMGGITKVYPDSYTSPFAAFENYLGFTAKPFDDVTVRGQVYTCFPDFSIAIDSLYFDYIMSDFLYISAGATGTGWGNSLLFDTNILDDSSEDVTKLFDTAHYSTKRFDAILTVPVGKGQLQGIGMYNGADTTELSSSYLSYAAAFEYPIGPVSVKVFGRRWANYDSHRMDPAAGIELTTDLMGNHVTLWGKVHAPKKAILDLDFDGISYAKFVGGVSRLIDADTMGKLGFAAEYQFIYDASKAKDKRKSNNIGTTFAWRHIADTDFSGAFQWFFDWDEKSGYFIPSLVFSGLRHVDITFVMPIIYGGASYTYNNSTFTSEKETPVVLMGLIFSLSVGY